MILTGQAGEVQCPLEQDYAVTSVSAQLYRPTDGAAMWTPAHTVTHPAWTQGAAVAAGARSLAVSTWSSSRVPKPGDVLVVDTGAVAERVEVESVSSLTVTLRDALIRAHTGASIRPAVARVPLSASDTATAGRAYRVRVTTTYTGQSDAEATEIRDLLFDAVAHVPRRTMTVERLRGAMPSAFSREAGSYRDDDGGWGELLDAAWTGVLEDVSRRARPDAIYSDADLEQATVQRALLIRAEDGTLYGEDVDRLAAVEHHERRYREALESALSSMSWVDVDEDAVPDDAEQQRSIRPRLSLVL